MRPASRQTAALETPLAAEWFHASYNLAAQYAHRALQPPTGARRRRNTVHDYFGAHDEPAHDRPSAEPERDLTQAELAARGVLGAGLRTLAGDHDAPGGTPRTAPRIVRLPPKGSTARADALTRFLEEVVLPTTALLLAGVLTRPGVGRLEELAGASVQAEPPEPPSERRLLEVLEDDGASATLPALLEAYALRGTPSYRTQYNAACLYAGRLDLGPEYEGMAFLRLAAALDTASAREQAQLADWASRDPSLARLRSVAPERFAATIGPYRPPPLEPEQPS